MRRQLFVTVLVLLAIAVSGVRSHVLAIPATPDSTGRCAGISSYMTTMSTLSRDNLLSLATRSPEVIPWAIGIDGNDIIGFGETQWQSLADAYTNRLLALNETEPPPALLEWRSAEVRYMTALIDLFQRLADSGGIQIGFDRWPEVSAIDSASADADTARVAARRDCPEFGDGPGHGSDKQYELICGEVDDYISDLTRSIDRASRITDPGGNPPSLDVLTFPPSAIDRSLSNALATEIARITPPPVLTIWQMLLLERLGYDPGIAYATPPSLEPVADFDWYTNLAAYTCEEFPMDQR
jgi:hypothetical protein